MSNHGKPQGKHARDKNAKKEEAKPNAPQAASAAAAGEEEDVPVVAEGELEDDAQPTAGEAAAGAAHAAAVANEDEPEGQSEAEGEDEPQDESEPKGEDEPQDESEAEGAGAAEDKAADSGGAKAAVATATQDVQASEGESDSSGEPAGSTNKAAHAGVALGSAIPELAPVEAAPGGYVVAGFGEIPKKKRRRALKAFGITVGVLAAVVLVAYLAGAAVFSGRFLPRTQIGEYDVSMKSDAEVVELLDSIVDGYQLDVIGGGFTYRTTGKGIGLALDSSNILSDMHEDENCWRWPLLFFQSSHDETDRLVVDFKPSVYEGDVTAAIEKFNEGARAPVNATITYDEKNDKFVVKPEEVGTQLDPKSVLESMGEAIEELDTKVEIGAEHLLQPTVRSDDAKLIEAAELATGMVSADLSLMMAGQPVGEVGGEMLSQFITVNDAFEVTFKEEELNAWADNLAANYNTIGTERAFTRADGKQVSVPAGGSYGWEIDTEALKNAVLEGIKAGEKAEIEVPCVETAAVYNGVGQRDWGNRYIDVDITEQHVRFYGDDGSIIWEDDCISGAPDGKHDTGPGTWYVNNKESPSKLIGYEDGKKIYETTVTYWMAFEGNGIGFHDANWQPGFGGSMYANGYGSHGCVNLSPGAAKNLYGLIEYGDVVVVHY